MLACLLANHYMSRSRREEGGENTKTTQTRYIFKRNYGCHFSQVVSGERRRPETRGLVYKLLFIGCGPLLGLCRRAKRSDGRC